MQYSSPNSGEECSAAQLLAEIAVTREASKKGIKLPIKFWNLPQWRLKYITQIQAANTLLKTYHEVAVIKAFQCRECSWMYSLRSPQLIPFIRGEEEKLEQLNNSVQQSEPTVLADVNEVRKVTTGKSKLSKLRDF